MSSIKYNYISEEPDYRHLNDGERYKALYEEVGTVEANTKLEWRQEWMKHFNPKPCSNILELGAHNGPNLLYYAKQGHTVHGIELSETLIETFRANIVREAEDVRNRITMEQGWIEEFKPKKEYDYVLCTEILEHVVDPVKILDAAKTAVKPNGSIYITSPSNHWGNNTHVRGVPMEDLKRWLEQAGLTYSEIWCEVGRTFCYAIKSSMKVYGLLRIRNEQNIISDTLDHLSRFCNGGVFVYDDASEDNTVEICKKHPIVKDVIENKKWDSNRIDAEYRNRAAVLSRAKRNAGLNDWFVYIDADERIEYDWAELRNFGEDVHAVRMKLFDYYVTPDDLNQKYTERRWIGPEYRKIIIAFRNIDTLSYSRPDQREVDLGSSGKIVDSGFVKHYGKAISVEQWEQKCDYYSKYFPAYSDKWNNRRGKAIHKDLSDFGNKLIRWNEKGTNGIDVLFIVDANLENPLYEIHECDICGENNFQTLKMKPTQEWDQVKKFYRDNGILNIPFHRIPPTFNLVQCTTCGLVFVNPRLKDGIVNNFYESYLSGEYKNYIPDYNTDYRENVFRRYVELIKERKSNIDNILDIGCATGGLLKVAKESGWKTTGIEISESAAGLAKQFGEIMIGDVEVQLDAIKDKFDVVTMIDVLEHVKSPSKVIRLVHQKLKERGIIFIEVPDVYAERDEMSRHFHLFSKSTLTTMLERNGFADVRFEEMDSGKYNPQDEEYSERFLHVTATKINQQQKRKLKVLLTNHHLLDCTGSEIFTYVLADYLQMSGQEVTVYSKYVDKMKPHLDAIKVRVVQTLEEIQHEKFDLAHVHHNINAMEIRYYFPELPIVFLSHGVLPFFEQPPVVDVGISHYLAVSEEVKQHLISKEIDASIIDIFRNIIDGRKFYPTSKINISPKKALILSNRIDEEKVKIISDACNQLKIEYKFVGGKFGEVDNWSLPELINEADIVFSLGRGVVEAMLCGRVPIVYDYLGGDGMVTPDNVQLLMQNNFSGRCHRMNFTVEDLVKEIKKYNASNAGRLREFALEHFSGFYTIESIIKIYHQALDSPLSHKLDPTQKKLLETFIETVKETRNYTYNLWQRREKSKIEIIPQDYSPIVQEAESYIQQNLLSKARDLLEQVIQDDPASIDAFNNLAVVEMLEGNTDKALIYLQQVLKIQPSNEIAKENLTYLREVLLSDNDLKIDSIDNDQEYIRTQQLIEEGKYEEATAILERLVKAPAPTASYLNDLGALYFQSGQYDLALSYVDKAHKLDQHNISILKNLVDIYCELKRYSDAIHTLQIILNHTPEDIEALITMGDICSILNRNEGAIFFYARARELDFNNIQALEMLERLKDTTFSNLLIKSNDVSKTSDSHFGKTSKHTSIIIPAIRNINQLQKCLKSLEEIIKEQKSEIILVNNGQYINLHEYFKIQENPNLRIISLSDKFTTSSALNIASRVASYDNLVFLDPRMIADKSWLSRLLWTFSSNDITSGATSKILYTDNTLAEAGCSSVKENKLKGFGEGATINDPRYNYRKTINSGSQYCLMINKNTFAEINGFDSNITSFELSLVDIGKSMASKDKTIFYQPYSVLKFQDEEIQLSKRNQPSLEVIKNLRPEILPEIKITDNFSRDNKKKVLVLGICLANKMNNLEDIASNLALSDYLEVTQRWMVIGEKISCEVPKGVSIEFLDELKPKYEILNGLILSEKIDQYDYILNVDDDIVLPERFLDHFISLQSQLGYAIAQPARTNNSYIDHPIVGKQDGVIARQTWFVEIGPVVSFHKTIYGLVFPFDLTSGMGWGYENIWAYLLKEKNLKMGIIDAIPVDHSLRKPVENYDWSTVNEERNKLLSKQNHLLYDQCFIVNNVVTQEGKI